MVLDRHDAQGARSGDVDFIEAWLQNLDRPEDINEVDYKGRTVLHLCAKGYDNHYNADRDGPRVVTEQSITAIAMILAKGGADLNLGDKYGWTPLHHACASHRVFGTSVIPALLAAGANVNAKTSEGRKEDKFGVNAAVQTPLATAIDWIRDAGNDESGGFAPDCLHVGLEYVSILLRHGASLDDCWAGAPVENLLRHVEDRTTPAMEMWFGNDKWTASIPSGLSQNEDFLACKALIKKARSEPRKTILMLRALAIKGRAKTADPVMNFLVGIPDGVAGNVLSFWPPAARYYEVRRPGTSQVPFRPKREVAYVPGMYVPINVVYHSISASPAYSGKSFEELRLEDYDQARDEGRWWPGGGLHDSTGHPVPPLRVPATWQPYFPTHKIWSGNVGLSVDGDVEYVNVHLEVVYHAITAMPEYSGKSFEELRLDEIYQEGRDWGNRLRRVCADCGRSLTRENYSNTQLKKRVGISRCKDCVVRVWPT